MKHFLSRRFCRRCHYVFCVSLFFMMLFIRIAECVPVSQTAGGSETGTLFMTIYDMNGVKRLLSSRHATVLTQGVYFVFPSDVKDCEVCQNDGIWTRAASKVYVWPQKIKDAVLCVRFRAKGNDGNMRYSRSFVLVGNLLSKKITLEVPDV